MTITDGFRERLRRYIDEGEATRFTDAELDDILRDSRTIYEAASMCWTIKAGMMQREMGDVERLTLGQETEQLVSLRDRVEYALTMADRYAAMTKRGSVILKVTQPEVL